MDVETNKLMQELIRSEFKDHTVIAVEHTLSNILDYDRIAVFDTGRLVEFDSPEALLGRPSAFRALYTS
jgi:ABC-type multidrug transport system fused ATPase/permease subunit